MASLEKKTIVQLRGIAQSMGMVPRMDVGREQLLQDIALYAGDKVKEPARPVVVNIVNQADGAASSDSLREALKDFVALGLRITFPSAGTWMLYCNGKYDSGSMTVPMWNIVQCARELVKP